jgi:trk system potassium uptake protein
LRRLGGTFGHPARIIPAGFLAVITIGTVLLSLPIATTPAGGPTLLVAAFTSVSATCVTGLVVVDTPSYWTPFGHGVILALIQVGGFGIMTGASLLGLLVARRLGLRTRLRTQHETRTLDLGDVRQVVTRVAVLVIACEVALATVLTLRFLVTYDYPPGRALWHGVFHAVSAFNNAGFALYTNSLIRFARDWWVCLPICVAVIVGGIGFPVLLELRRAWRRPRSWTIHTKLTVGMTGLLLLAGFGALLLFESRNMATLGQLDGADRTLAAITQAVMPRTAGFNSVEIGFLRAETLTVMDALMFVGGGSAGTAGGIKVTTFSLLAFVILAEIRGQRDVTVGTRRVDPRAQRQALTIALLGVAVVAVGTMALLADNRFSLDRVLFEAASAFGTVGLSTGITADLVPRSQWVLIVLMYVGRVGTITAATALALRSRDRLYRWPEERPIVG